MPGKRWLASAGPIHNSLFANVVSPAAATLIAAIAVAVGGNEMVGAPRTKPKMAAGSSACSLVAVFGFIATVSGVFKKQFEDRLVLGKSMRGTTTGARFGDYEWQYTLGRSHTRIWRSSQNLP